jgi:hypothetical protein
MHADDDTLDGREDAAPEARKPLHRFGAQKRPERDGRRPPCLIDWNEVDRE